MKALSVLSLVISVLALAVAGFTLYRNYFFVEHNLKISLASDIFDVDKPAQSRWYNNVSFEIDALVLNLGNRPEAIMYLALGLFNQGGTLSGPGPEAFVITGGDSKPFQLKMTVDS